ncbi:MAG: ATP synthase F1 subunit delta [Planctomycetes bacterium]|nr:ATP synthase F1 subunit delta [Planctomycetota bacterium]
MSLLAKRYASALFSLAAAGGVADAVGRDLTALHADFQTAEARALLTSPDIGSAERGIVLEKIGHGRHQLVQNLIGVLQHRRRFEVLFDIAPAFHELLLESRNEIEGTVESARSIDAAGLERLAALAGKLSGKKVTLTAVHTPELLGGVRLRVGNKLYDGSMQSALEQLESRLLQAAI